MRVGALAEAHKVIAEKGILSKLNRGVPSNKEKNKATTSSQDPLRKIRNKGAKRIIGIPVKIQWQKTLVVTIIENGILDTWYCNKDPFSKSSLKRLSSEIRFANRAQIQIEEIDILSRDTYDLSKVKGKIKIHNKKNARENQDLFVLIKYPLLSLQKNK